MPPDDPDALSIINQRLRRMLTPSAERFEAARADPRLRMAMPPSPPGMDQMQWMEAIASGLKSGGLGGAAEGAGMEWLQDQPWYRSLSANPIAQAAALAYMLSQRTLPQVNFEIPF